MFCVHCLHMIMRCIFFSMKMLSWKVRLVLVRHSVCYAHRWHGLKAARHRWNLTDKLGQQPCWERLEKRISVTKLFQPWQLACKELLVLPGVRVIFVSTGSNIGKIIYLAYFNLWRWHCCMKAGLCVVEFTFTTLFILFLFIFSVCFLFLQSKTYLVPFFKS